MVFYTTTGEMYFSTFSVSGYEYEINVSGAVCFLNGIQKTGSFEVKIGDRYFFVSENTSNITISIDGVIQEISFENIVDFLTDQTTETLLKSYLTTYQANDTQHYPFLSEPQAGYLTSEAIDEIFLDMVSNNPISSITSKINTSIVIGLRKGVTTIDPMVITDAIISTGLSFGLYPEDTTENRSMYFHETYNYSYNPTILSMDSFVTEFITDTELLNIAQDVYNIIWNPDQSIVSVSVMSESDVYWFKQQMTERGIQVQTPDSLDLQNSYIRKIDLLSYTDENLSLLISDLLNRINTRIQYSRSIIAEDLSEKTTRVTNSIQITGDSEYQVSIITGIIKLDSPSFLSMSMDTFEDILSKVTKSENQTSTETILTTYTLIDSAIKAIPVTSAPDIVSSEVSSIIYKENDTATETAFNDQAKDLSEPIIGKNAVATSAEPELLNSSNPLENFTNGDIASIASAQPESPPSKSEVSSAIESTEKETTTSISTTQYASDDITKIIPTKNETKVESGSLSKTNTADSTETSSVISIVSGSQEDTSFVSANESIAFPAPVALADTEGKSITDSSGIVASENLAPADPDSIVSKENEATTETQENSGTESLTAIELQPSSQTDPNSPVDVNKANAVEGLITIEPSSIKGVEAKSSDKPIFMVYVEKKNEDPLIEAVVASIDKVALEVQTPDNTQTRGVVEILSADVVVDASLNSLSEVVVSTNNILTNEEEQRIQVDISEYNLDSLTPETIQLLVDEGKIPEVASIISAMLDASVAEVTSTKDTQETTEEETTNKLVSLLNIVVERILNEIASSPEISDVSKIYQVFESIERAFTVKEDTKSPITESISKLASVIAVLPDDILTLSPMAQVMRETLTSIRVGDSSIIASSLNKMMSQTEIVAQVSVMDVQKFLLQEAFYDKNSALDQSITDYNKILNGLEESFERISLGGSSFDALPAISLLKTVVPLSVIEEILVSRYDSADINDKTIVESIVLLYSNDRYAASNATNEVIENIILSLREFRNIITERGMTASSIRELVSNEDSSIKPSTSEMITYSVLEEMYKTNTEISTLIDSQTQNTLLDETNIKNNFASVTDFITRELSNFQASFSVLTLASEMVKNEILSAYGIQRKSEETLDIAAVSKAVSEIISSDKNISNFEAVSPLILETGNVNFLLSSFLLETVKMVSLIDNTNVGFKVTTNTQQEISVKDLVTNYLTENVEDIFKTTATNAELEKLANVITNTVLEELKTVNTDLASVQEKETLKEVLRRVSEEGINLSDVISNPSKTELAVTDIVVALVKELSQAFSPTQKIKAEEITFKEVIRNSVNDALLGSAADNTTYAENIDLKEIVTRVVGEVISASAVDNTLYAENIDLKEIVKSIIEISTGVSTEQTRTSQESMQLLNIIDRVLSSNVDAGTISTITSREDFLLSDIVLNVISQEIGFIPGNVDDLVQDLLLVDTTKSTSVLDNTQLGYKLPSDVIVSVLNLLYDISISEDVSKELFPTKTVLENVIDFRGVDIEDLLLDMNVKTAYNNLQKIGIEIASMLPRIIQNKEDLTTVFSDAFLDEVNIANISKQSGTEQMLIQIISTKPEMVDILLQNLVKPISLDLHDMRYKILENVGLDVLASFGETNFLGEVVESSYLLEFPNLEEANESTLTAVTSVEKELALLLVKEYAQQLINNTNVIKGMLAGELNYNGDINKPVYDILNDSAIINKVVSEALDDILQVKALATLLPPVAVEIISRSLDTIQERTILKQTSTSGSDEENQIVKTISVLINDTNIIKLVNEMPSLVEDIVFLNTESIILDRAVAMFSAENIITFNPVNIENVSLDSMKILTSLVNNTNVPLILDWIVRTPFQRKMGETVSPTNSTETIVVEIIVKKEDLASLNIDTTTTTLNIQEAESDTLVLTSLVDISTIAGVIVAKKIQQNAITDIVNVKNIEEIKTYIENVSNIIGEIETIITSTDGVKFLEATDMVDAGVDINETKTVLYGLYNSVLSAGDLLAMSTNTTISLDSLKIEDIFKSVKQLQSLVYETKNNIQEATTSNIETTSSSSVTQTSVIQTRAQISEIKQSVSQIYNQIQETTSAELVYNEVVNGFMTSELLQKIESIDLSEMSLSSKLNIIDEIRSVVESKKNIVEDINSSLVGANIQQETVDIILDVLRRTTQSLTTDVESLNKIIDSVSTDLIGINNVNQLSGMITQEVTSFVSEFRSNVETIRLSADLVKSKEVIVYNNIIQSLLTSLEDLYKISQLVDIKYVALTAPISGTRITPYTPDLKRPGEYDVYYLSWETKSRKILYGSAWSVFKYARFNVEFYFIDRKREIYMLVTPGNTFEAEQRYLAHIKRLYGSYILGAVF